MVVTDLVKPNFNRDQFVPASKASKSLGDVRKKAKEQPQVILDHNKLDSVILGYEQYEKMYRELEFLRDMVWEVNIAKRLENADKNPTVRYTLQDVMGEEEYREFEKLDPNLISDEDLFE